MKSKKIGQVDVLVQCVEEKALFKFYAKTPSTEKQTSTQIKKVQIQFLAVWIVLNA